ncbi:MAG: bifunctional folylpolyglutamate synthase/dihydrofolate synthase [Blautia sp.]|jgi:dihydrofolate synthase/folylpolyglutamate synthase
MNYEEARVYLANVSKYGSVLGLENMKELLGRLGNPQDELKFIHISGTNGKGSLLAYLSTILSCAGYRTGRYLSPTLFSYRERIQVDGEMIDRDSLARHVTAIALEAEQMKAEGKGCPTVFEIETALSFLYFREKCCDIVVLETGFGGLLDATNIVKTTVMEVITPISMDHMDILGSTIEEIAANKAGIIKPHTAVVSAPQQSGAVKVIADTCKEKKCSLHLMDPAGIRDVAYGYEIQSFTYKKWEQLQISLAGSYQIDNGALAAEAVEVLRNLGYELPDEKVYEGFRRARWKGRFSPIHKNPIVILDGAHNPAAARVFRNSLELYFKGRKIYYIFGVFKDKDYPEIIKITAPCAEHIVTVQTPDNPRALSAGELAKAVSTVNPSVEAAGSITEAVEKCFALATNDDVIAAFGSLSFLGEVERAVQMMEE